MSISLHKQKTHQKTQERNNYRRSSFERFGRHLLKQINSDAIADDIKWDELITNFIKYNNHAFERSAPGLMYINWVVSKEFGFDPVEVRSNTRVRRITKVKHTAMYLAVTLFRYKYDALQDFYNISNHASIVNAMDVARNYLFTEKDYRIKIDILTDKLLGYGRNEDKIIERPDTEIRS